MVDADVEGPDGSLSAAGMKMFKQKKPSPCQEVGKEKMEILFQGLGFPIHLLKTNTMTSFYILKVF